MNLDRYREKREFEKTPEPRGAEERALGSLRFVVQKHRARSLHYDLRLELDGVLKSWAVPKGPSLDFSSKHLAMAVEDHPLDYRTFEGVIPPGNYGAGTVMVWDEGVYHAVGSHGREENEKMIADGLKKGHLSFVLEGEKLRGEFSLVKLARAIEKNAWLLIKKNDEFATDEDITHEDRSVLSGRNLEEIAEEAPEVGAVWASSDKEIDLADAPEAEMPRGVEPMLAMSVDAPFDRANWLFEIKWDGFRALAELDDGEVRLFSRNRRSFNERFPSVVEDLMKLKRRAVLDGEVAVLDEAGRSDFQLLQKFTQTGKGRLVYYVFDLLYLDGRDLRNLPLERRKAILRKVLPDLPTVKFSDHVEEKGRAFYEAAARQGLEGILAKNGRSVYLAGKRSRDWLKVKIQARQEAVIGGFTEPRGGRKHLGSLVLGVYREGELVYIGHAGGGFDEVGLAAMRAKLEPLIQPESPFVVPPKTNAPVHWVRPELVCEVKFREWTGEGLLRQPIVLGLREDKPAKAVVREIPRSTSETLGESPHQAKTASASIFRAPLREGEQIISVDGRPLKLTNLKKVFWPDEGYTKGDLISYYREVASFIIPHLKDRPESLHRHPDGIYGQSFYHKNVRALGVAWADTLIVHSAGESRDITYFLCQDEASLVYLANLGCIEINPWLSRKQALDKPDYLVIDLDPLDVPFERVVDAALAVKETLEEVGVQGYCKTSGATGLHVYVPLGGAYDYEQAKEFAQIVAYVAHDKAPDITSVERLPERRHGRVYLDFLQNRAGQTLAAPYSVRPRPGAPVSTPLRWEEVHTGLDPHSFTIKNVFERLQTYGDLFAPVLGEGADLLSALRRLG